jgi:hypothetical protein
MSGGVRGEQQTLSQRSIKGKESGVWASKKVKENLTEVLYPSFHISERVTTTQAIG